MSNVYLLKPVKNMVIIKFMSGRSKKSICEELGLPRELVDELIYKSFGIKPRKQGEKNDNNN